MSKPRCPFYPHETARRHCPALDEAICSRACREKYVVEIDCPSECPHIEENLRFEFQRMQGHVTPRLKSEFAVYPDWLDDPGIVTPFFLVETQLARFAQWYPDLADQEAFDILDDLELVLRSNAANLTVAPRFQAGRGFDLRRHLELRLDLLVKGALREKASPQDTLDAYLLALPRIRGSGARHAADGPRGYLEFLIRFSDKVDPKPVVSRLILPGM